MYHTHTNSINIRPHSLTHSAYGSFEWNGKFKMHHAHAITCPQNLAIFNRRHIKTFGVQTRHCVHTFCTQRAFSLKAKHTPHTLSSPLASTRPHCEILPAPPHTRNTENTNTRRQNTHAPHTNHIRRYTTETLLHFVGGTNRKGVRMIIHVCVVFCIWV